MTKKKIPHKILHMNLEVHKYPPETLFLRTEVASGKINGLDLEFSTNASGEPIVRIGDGSWYLLDIRKFIEAVADAEGVPAKAK
jgi:hypothetical protein